MNRMKKLLLPLCLTALNLSAQQSIAILENEAIRCNITSTGDLFNTFQQSGFPGFEAPANSGIRSIYAANFWLSGTDQNNQSHLAAELYQDGARDWYCGPLTNDGSALVTEETQLAYDRLWAGNADEIATHRSQFDGSGNIPNYEIPQWMIEWPAHGNAAVGQDYYLAPFVDHNNNQIYDPENGDYPLFCGDRCLLWIFNDAGGEHNKSNGQFLGVQIIATAYVFDDPLLAQSVFFNYKIKNMSSSTYNDAHMGWFTDFDLGNPNDDQVATWVSHNAVYAYNGDDVDENSLSAPGYTDDLAMAAFVLLNGPPQDPDGVDNPLAQTLLEAQNTGGTVYPLGRNGYGDTVIDNERLGLRHSLITNASGSGQTPASLAGFANQLSGAWADGLPLTYGDDGRNPANIPAQFMFPDNTDPYALGTQGVGVNGWTAEDGGVLPSDKRALAITSSFTFEPGELLDIDFAYTFVRDSQSKEGLLNQMYWALVNNHSFYSDELSTCNLNDNTTSTETSDLNSIEVYPNPTTGRIYIRSGMNIASLVNIYDATGARILEQLVQENNSIDVSNLSNGLYQVILQTNGLLTSHKICIAH
jgi:Secretion system C-terminal sorting domain